MERRNVDAYLRNCLAPRQPGRSKDETGNEGFALTKATAAFCDIQDTERFPEQACPSREGVTQRLEPLAGRSVMSRQHDMADGMILKDRYQVTDRHGPEYKRC